MTKNNFLKGAAILGIAGIVIKILGAFYRIPLSNMIRPEGMGYFQTAYPLYTLLAAISTSGFPTAIAKITSEKRALQDYRGAHRVFKVSFVGFLLAGILTSLVFFLGADIIVEKLGNNNAYYSMIAMSPALFFVPIMSAFRGYFQGRQVMTPTAISQLVEQVFRVVVGLLLAYLFLGKGLPQAAGGASFGASAGAIAGTIVIIFVYARERKKISEEIKQSVNYEIESISAIVKRILSIAIPITIGASIVPIMSTIDTTLIMNRLQVIGYSESQASDLYGQLTGNAQTLINFPQVLSVAIAVSLVPAISNAFAKRSYSEVRNLTASGVRVTLLIGLPAALGLFVLATPIIELLYYSYDAATQASVGTILRILSLGLIFLTLVQSLTAILQGLGKPLIPVRNLAIGAVIKVILTYNLTAIPEINIKGAALSTGVTYLIAAILNFIEVKKHTKVNFKIKDVFMKPIISTALMTLVVWAIYTYTKSFLGNTLVTLIAISVGVIVYGLSLLLTGAIVSRDFELIPGGNKLASKLKAIGLLRN